jgi:lysozyme
MQRTLHALAILVSMLAGCTMVGDDPDEDAVAGAGANEPADADSDPSALRICSDGSTLLGIDVSHHQGTINWSRVRDAGVQYAFIRVSDGIGTRDRKFAQNWAGAESVGLIHGAYQFFRPGQDVTAQAQLMIDAIEGSYGTLPPVLDVEADSGLSPSSVASKVRRWVDLVANATGRTPIIYTGKYFWRDDVGSPAGFTDNPLWVANYTTRCPDVPSTWSRWTFWQNTPNGRIGGISTSVDLNKFNGTYAQLEALTQ